MRSDKKTVKVPSGNQTKGNGKTGVKRPLSSGGGGLVCFCFSYFHIESVKVGNFTNFYKTEASSLAILSQFFNKIQELCKHSISELKSPAMQRQWHFNDFQDPASKDIVDRIEQVLRDGYGVNDKVIEEFERSYCELWLDGDGCRLICIKIDECILCPLFLDCNHMICIKSSKHVKDKQKFSVPCILGKSNPHILPDESVLELVDELVRDARDGKYDTFQQLFKEYEAITERSL